MNTMWMMHRWLRWGAAGCLALVFMLSMSVSADEPAAAQEANVTAQQQEADEKLLAALADQDFYVRQLAHEQLLQREDFDEHVERWMKMAQTLEQRHRLIDAARHHFIRELHTHAFQAQAPGAIGVSHSLMPVGTIEQVKSPVVMVIRTVPGFPGHAYLRPDDMIVELDGEPLPETANASTFGNWIQQYVAGDELSLGVWREGEVQTVRFTLVSAAALQALYPASGATLRLEQATAERWDKRKAQLLSLAPSSDAAKPAE